MVDSVVYKRRFTKTKKKSFAKIAFNITEIDDSYFVNQMTICSSDCFSLKPLIISALRGVISEKKIIESSNDIVVIGKIYEKRSKSAPLKNNKKVSKMPIRQITAQKIMCRRNKSLSLQNDDDLEPFKEPTEFIATKRYLSIKLLVSTRQNYFSSDAERIFFL